MRKKLSIKILKFSISGALLWILLAKIGTRELEETLSSANGLFIVLALGINTSSMLLGVYRWQVLLTVQGIYVPFRTLLSISMVSGFFGAFLPSGFGSDVVRGYDMVKYSNRGAGVLSSILIERFFALISLAAIGCCSLIFGFRWFAKNELLLRVIVITYAFIFLLTLLLLNRRVLHLVKLLIIRLSILQRFRGIMEEFIQSIETYRFHTNVLVIAMVISLALQTMGIIYFYVLALSISLQVSFLVFFMTVPLVWIATMAPISAGGMGVKEGMFVLLLSNIGVTVSQAFLISMLGTVLFIPFALMGCIVYITRQGFKKDNQISLLSHKT